MPTIEARVTLGFVLGRDAGLMERGVGGVLELGFSKPFVVVDGAIANELHLRNAGDCLQVGVEDALLLSLSLLVPMAIALGRGVEGLFFP